MSKTYLIAKVGINHNCFLYNTFKMINKSKEYRADSIKFQKNLIKLVFTKEILDTPRKSL